MKTAGSPRRRRRDGEAPRISTIISDLRLDTGLTQKKAAEEIGISAVTLSRIEQGDLRISARNLERILNFFDLTLSVASIVPADKPRNEVISTKDVFAKW